MHYYLFKRNYIIYTCKRDHKYTLYSFILQVVSKFENFLTNKGQNDLLCIPRYIISFTDSENDFLILEDASCLGFRAASRQNCIDWTECIAILKTLAKFHAISFAYKDQKKEEFIKIADSLEETFFGSNHWDWYKNYHVNDAKY